MKNSFRKALSMLLVLAMAIAIIPAIPAQALEIGDEEVYNFAGTNLYNGNTTLNTSVYIRAGNKTVDGVTVPIQDTREAYRAHVASLDRNWVFVDAATTSTNEGYYVAAARYNVAIRSTNTTDSHYKVEITVPETAYYDISNKIGHAGTDKDYEGSYVLLSKDGTQIAYSDIDNDYNTNGTSGVDVKFAEEVLLEKGTYTYEVHNSTSGIYVYLYNLTLTKVGEDPNAAPAIEADFGDTYAYIQENNDGRDTTYTMALISSLGSKEYDAAGFEVQVGDGTAVCKAVSKLYRRARVDGIGEEPTTIRPSDLGNAGDPGYVICDVSEYSAEFANANVYVRPYVEVDGEKAYGSWMKIAGVASAAAAQ